MKTDRPDQILQGALTDNGAELHGQFETGVPAQAP